MLSAVTILDWDDTLFPSTNKSDHDLSLLEPVICNLVENLKQRSLTVIVTNSQTGWINLCLEQHGWESLRQILVRVPIFSARDWWEKDSPDPTEWKKRAFESLLNQIPTVQLISIGDSESEHEALKHSVRMKHIRGKCVRMLERPTVEQMRYQCAIITDSLDWLYHAPHDVDYHFTIQDNQVKEIRRDELALSVKPGNKYLGMVES